jgi:hypothetical protein
MVDYTTAGKSEDVAGLFRYKALGTVGSYCSVFTDRCGPLNVEYCWSVVNIQWCRSKLFIGPRPAVNRLVPPFTCQNSMVIILQRTERSLFSVPHGRSVVNGQYSIFSGPHCSQRCRGESSLVSGLHCIHRPAVFVQCSLDVY